jgi:epoxyqueuosine reductase
MKEEKEYNMKEEKECNMKEEIREKVLEFGADICRFTGIDRLAGAPDGFHPRDIFPACESIVTFAVALPKGLYMVDSRLIYSHFNTLACSRVDRITYRTAAFLEKMYYGIGVPIPCDGPYDYWEEEKMEGRGLLSMKHIAFYAGIGTFGKNTLLLNRDYGNRLLIGCVLTDLKIESDELSAEVCLEHCELCIQNCPAGAISESGVIQKSCRVNSYGHTKRGFDTVECNRCRTVCPMRFGANTCDK